MITAEDQILSGMDKAVDGDGCFTSRHQCIHYGIGSGDHIAAGEYKRNIRLIGHLRHTKICIGIRQKLDVPGECQQVRFLSIIDHVRCLDLLFLQILFQHDTLDIALGIGLHLFDFITEEELDPFRFCHVGVGLQGLGHNSDLTGTQPDGRSGCIQCRLCSAQHHDVTSHGGPAGGVDTLHKGLQSHNTLGVLTGNAHLGGCGSTNAQEDGFKALLLFQLRQSDIFSYIHAKLELNSHLLQDLHFLLDQSLVQIEGRDTVLHFAADLLLPFEHSDRIAFDGQIIGTGQSGRTGADDGDLLFKLDSLGVEQFGNLPVSFLQTPVADELHHFVDGQALVHGGTGTYTLRQIIIHTAADGGERDVFGDHVIGLTVSSLRGKLQDPLIGKAGGIGGLAGRRTHFQDIRTIGAEFRVVLLRSPEIIIGQGIGFRAGHRIDAA